MSIKLLCVGKTTESYINVGINEYITRLNKYCKFELSILPDIKNAAKMPIEHRKSEEGKSILKNIQPNDWLVLLDENGKTYSSVDFANLWQNWFNGAKKQIICIIGGPYGFSKEVYARANEKISLSPMTFTHEMVRLIFTEQLYRSFTIIKNEPYHHK